MRFEGKVAIVTGGARGIGRATAELFGREGAKVLVNYRESEVSATEVAARINAERPNSALAFRADVADPAAVKRMVDACVETFGGVDILVAVAGFSQKCTIFDVSDELWRKTLGINLDGVLFSNRAVVPYMVKRRGGAIVNVASTSAFNGGVVSVAYAASKGGVVALTKKLGRELAPIGIRVNAVAPGWVDTDLRKKAEAAFGSEFTSEAIGKTVPIGRICTPEEIARTIAFLCSEDASYIAGECVMITGGAQ